MLKTPLFFNQIHAHTKTRQQIFVIRVVFDLYRKHYLNKGVAIGKFLWSIH